MWQSVVNGYQKIFFKDFYTRYNDLFGTPGIYQVYNILIKY